MDNNLIAPFKPKLRLICVSQCKKFALEFAKSTRHYKFSRVSEDFLVACEVSMRNYIQNRISAQPSKGKTLL